MKTLSRYTVSAAVFEQILETYKHRIQLTNFFEEYVKGYADKNTIIFNDDGLLIMTVLALRPIVHKWIDDRDWLQVIVEYNENQRDDITKDISGLTAFKRFEKLLAPWYNEDEIFSVLSKKWMKGKKHKKQLHFVRLTDGVIERRDNCYKYDINGAHAYVLSRMFPKAKEAILAAYKARKENPEIKKVFNYSVGWFAHLGYRSAYNYIVTTITDIMEETVYGIGGNILYVNTDGFIVQNPLYELSCSDMLGDWKEEYHGTIYFYSCENYWVYQNEKETKGSIMCSARDKIDLKNGISVSYKKIELNDGYYVASDVKEIKCHQVERS